MTRVVLLSSRAQREFDGLDPGAKRRVREALLRLAETGRGDVKKLKGVSGGIDLLRLRVGDVRVTFELTAKAIRVTRVLPRSAGYDWL